jgi:hypothetical protein
MTKQMANSIQTVEIRMEAIKNKLAKLQAIKKNKPLILPFR